MKSSEIRSKFLTFFESKGHRIVGSAPMVIKNDPTLMFTNAGMNQFKDYFLGHKPAVDLRVANSQKCLRVSGKHNDLEEVGIDTYHHTMFEMLGNWSFGDYFKAEAIDWAWELLTNVYKIDKSRLYVTVFGGDNSENLAADSEAYDLWKALVPEDHIIYGSKKDNFWEMGESGPCGPCSEIHVDMRTGKDYTDIPGNSLVNKDHPEVLEIWNLVFIEFNRSADGSLSKLPNRHIDTGMGFERLCRIMQGKKSNYDTDIFKAVIDEIGRITAIPYGREDKTDVAMRVIADHLRAVAFSIADGQLPSNNKAGYVIRRILRRAIRYGYTYLKQEDPFIYKLLPVFQSVMGDMYTELTQQQELISRVINEEENAFLKTLATGIRLLDQVVVKAKESGTDALEGRIAFELYDTYGFPLDLTALILKENNMTVDQAGFDAAMSQQKERSRSAASSETQDWMVLKPGIVTRFTGYDLTSGQASITQYRSIKTKNKVYWHLVFDKTPFYAESGGQVGDTGVMAAGNSQIKITGTRKENELIIHITEELPPDPNALFELTVDSQDREKTAANHSATHLLHYALREILGKHVEQKGSLVSPEYLRFDFAHFQKVTEDEIRKVELLVNDKIRKNLLLEEQRSVAFKEAVAMNAVALFGEKYGDTVRVIRFGESVELCGGTHVAATGQIGLFRISSEMAVAAGIRRIEAISGEKAIEYSQNQTNILNTLSEVLSTNSSSLDKSIELLMAENKSLKKEMEQFRREKMLGLKDTLIKKSFNYKGNIKVIIEQIETDSVETGKDLVFELNRELPGSIIFLGAAVGDKPNLWLMISEELVNTYHLNAVEIIRESARHINGGGGGQPFFANAGGKDINGIQKALEHGKHMIAAKFA